MALEIDDDDFVAAELADAMDLDPDDLTIEDGDFSTVTTKKASLGLSKEFVVFANEDDAEKAALEYVAASIKDDPELWHGAWLNEFYDEEDLKRIVEQSVRDQDEAEELAQRPRRFYEAAESAGLDLPEEDEDGDLPSDVPQDLIDQYQEMLVTDATNDPRAWLAQIYGDDGVDKYIRENVDFNYEAAAEAAVNADGWEHYLSHNDGNSYTTQHGLIYIQIHGNVIASDAERGKAPREDMGPL